MRKCRTLAAGLITLAAVAAGGRSLKAQALADRLPDDAVAYAGWAGSDALGPAYDASHLKAFLNTLNLPQFIADAIQSEAAKEADPQKIENGKLVTAWLTAMAKAPTAVYMGPVDVTNIAKPRFRAALVSRVGKQAAGELADKIDVLIHRDNPPDAPVHHARALGDYLVVTVGEADLDQRLQNAPAAGNLAASATFKNALAQVKGDHPASAAWIYLDVEAGMKAVDQALKQAPNPQTQQMVPIILDGLGVPSLNQIAWSGSFDGANWRSDTFIGMKEKRNGLLTFFDHPTLTEWAYAAIPQTATAAGVIRWDGQEVVKEMEDVAKRISDRAPQQLELIFQQIYAFSGVDVKNDLAPAFGDEFVMYCSAAAAGNSLRGFTVVNKLRDARKAETAMSALEAIINLSILQRNANSKAQFRADTLPAPLDRVTAHVMALDTITPAWAIDDGVFYFSLSLAGLQSAIEQAHPAAGTKTTSILNNPLFVDVQKRIGHDNNFGFVFADLSAGSAEAYEVFGRALAEAMQENPGHPYSLPPLEKIVPDLGPMLSVSWSDAAGYHGRDAAPLPGAQFLAPTELVFMRLREMITARLLPNGQRPGGALP